MIDHHRERHPAEMILERGDDGGAGIDLHVPAEPADLLGGGVEHSLRVGGIEASRGVGFEIEPHAANARGRHVL